MAKSKFVGLQLVMSEDDLKYLDGLVVRYGMHSRAEYFNFLFSLSSKVLESVHPHTKLTLLDERSGMYRQILHPTLDYAASINDH